MNTNPYFDALNAINDSLGIDTPTPDETTHTQPDTAPSSYYTPEQVTTLNQYRNPIHDEIEAGTAALAQRINNTSHNGRPTPGNDAA